MEAAFLGLVMVLQRDQEPFDGTQWQHRRDQDERPPQERMNPVRRRVENFDGQGRARNNKPGKEHDEKSRPVGRIDEEKVKAAGLAPWTQSEKPLKQAALAAARTTSQEPGHDGRWRSVGGLGHIQPICNAVTAKWRVARRFSRADHTISKWPPPGLTAEARAPPSWSE